MSAKAVLSPPHHSNILVFGYDIKRRIPLSKIGGITASTKNTEFIIHVPSEYDYCYDSP